MRDWKYLWKLKETEKDCLYKASCILSSPALEKITENGNTINQKSLNNITQPLMTIKHVHCDSKWRGRMYI